MFKGMVLSRLWIRKDPEQFPWPYDKPCQRPCRKTERNQQEQKKKKDKQQQSKPWNYKDHYQGKKNQGHGFIRISSPYRIVQSRESKI